ncbi:MAG TPA: DinB family protein [Candidatus Kapabacteria bacterium]|nr:DinB family protein [Candidatus Kapabacteria bacterium]
MHTEPHDPLRSQLQRVLDWHGAHATFEDSVRGVPAELRGASAPGIPHSPWQLLEHLRLTQLDILDFCRNPDYREQQWPDDYWPASAAPPDGDAWDASVAAFIADREELKRMAGDPSIDLFAPIPHGNGQTILRELLLVVDHNAYHVGQLVIVRRALGNWPSA